ncbi:MAG: sugar ABC transporter ATP-binding protein [Alicyclobacillus macrosporangiidus]|uniref:sugar ABC transporter ATP-binding protein n=1 Tax=Alicyclobacillus macrosporangiidus TaxID=392015 RepID=UPI0026F2381F|nr:sugar ABC transporter ATP-binding protein [Alicyclobacillus macrosporangiidus]MCL6599771.1 sugar ABC transporter ATP-binding protein [Alicyclobacillus macrosporangiidus]
MSGRLLLSAKGITKVFPGTRALSNVSLDIYGGEVHAIMGENGAGKSTLMNILSGAYQPDEGSIVLEGRSVRFSHPRDAQLAGISIVHQELSLCNHLSVAENLFMGRMPRRRFGFIDFSSLYERTRQLLSEFGNHGISPSTPVSSLSVSQQQVVEIAKALSFDCKILILDEPTSSLSEAEVGTLFSLIRRLKERGLGILYISHKFNEIFEICDRVTVLRDGEVVASDTIDRYTSEKIVSLMVGRTLKDYYPPKGRESPEVVFRVRNLSKRPKFTDVSFELRKGEILGVFGLVGAGRTEIARAICGIEPCESGEITIHGVSIKRNSIRDAIEHGLVYLTEDRKQQGLFLKMTVADNIVAPDLQSVSRWGFVDRRRTTQQAESFSTLLKAKFANVTQKVGELSGGNQQKIMVAKWLAVQPKVMILDEPTRGIDVGAKAEIHAILRQLANQGVGIIVISSELPEIIGISDRVLVIHQGRIAAELRGDQMREEEIMAYASGLK